MDSSFFQKPFDEETLLKLKLYRNYVDEWLPVFLTGKYSRPVHIFDFFCGPGRDCTGEPGSPLVAVQRMKKFCEDRSDVIKHTPSVTFHFSDIESKFIEELKASLKEVICSRECCRLDIQAGSFETMLKKSMPILSDPSCACLVWMDQCGFKEVTPDIVGNLASCPKTDILFFISSSYLHRFPDEPAVQGSFAGSTDRLGKSEYSTIHRDICDYFRRKLPDGIQYHLVPFSIKKSSNIYGLIFGSSNYLGLEKFLIACWGADEITGEANYPVDEDISTWRAASEGSLFAGLISVKKFDVFKNDLTEFIMKGADIGKYGAVTNHDIYEFVLENGFLPIHAREFLEELQNNGQIDVWDLEKNEKARKNAFYISRGAHKKTPRITVRMVDE